MLLLHRSTSDIRQIVPGIWRSPDVERIFLNPYSNITIYVFLALSSLTITHPLTFFDTTKLTMFGTTKAVPQIYLTGPGESSPADRYPDSELPPDSRADVMTSDFGLNTTTKLLEVSAKFTTAILVGSGKLTCAYSIKTKRRNTWSCLCRVRT